MAIELFSDLIASLIASDASYECAASVIPSQRDVTVTHHVEIFVQSDDGELLEIRDQLALVPQFEDNLLDPFGQVERGFGYGPRPSGRYRSDLIRCSYRPVPGCSSGSLVRVRHFFLKIDQLGVSSRRIFIPAPIAIEFSELFECAERALAG